MQQNADGQVCNLGVRIVRHILCNTRYCEPRSVHDLDIWKLTLHDRHKVCQAPNLYCISIHARIRMLDLIDGIKH